MTDLSLARDTAGLLSIANKSHSRSLNELVALTARQVRACSGATAALWDGSDLLLMAASHPDVCELTDVQAGGGGPEIEALTTGLAVHCEDTLSEARWPQFARAALARGVRCSFTLAHRSGTSGVTLSLFGARPRVLRPDELPLAELLVTVGGTVIGTMSQFGDAQRGALQLREATHSRALVDQAKGILMEALGCTADKAFDRMREISQQHNIKVTEVARRVIESRSAAIG
jgi:ANTAR domain